MNKRAYAILLVTLAALTVSFFLIWQFQQPEQSDVQRLYTSSLTASLESFRQYAETGAQSSYWDGVAEFRCFMKAYLVLHDGSTPDYLACNIVYGQMLSDPQSVQETMPALVEALGLLTREQTCQTGFLRISELANLLTH